MKPAERHHLLALGLALGLFGCPGSVDDPSRFGVGDSGSEAGQPMDCADPEAVVTNLFATQCGSSSCHGAGAPTIDLVSSGVRERLVDQESLACSGELLVSSSEPLTSYLLNKVTDEPLCGSPMPLGSGLISPAEYACLELWISNLVGGSPMTSADAGAAGDAAADGDAGGDS